MEQLHSEFQQEEACMTQLLAVASLSLAAKMEETVVPHPLDLQVKSIIIHATVVHKYYRSFSFLISFSLIFSVL
jgi:hypothetical protein